MSALLEVPGLGKATSCVISKRHSPVPTRYVWHHILPQVCGGKTTPENLVSLCDNCHYSIHALMYEMSQSWTLFKGSNKKQLALATQGYHEAALAGTANLLPNEGGATHG